MAGSQEAIDRLNELLYIYDTNRNPVVILGGGKVGRAAARALKQRDVPVHMVEKNPALAERIGDLPDRLVIGDVDGDLTPDPRGSTRLEPGCTLLAIGTGEQLERFREAFT